MVSTINSSIIYFNPYLTHCFELKGNTIGHKNTVSGKRHDFSEQIIKCIDEYSEKKITEAFSTKNKPLDTGTKAKFRKYVHHHLLSYKGFQTKTCDMIIDELISPLVSTSSVVCNISSTESLIHINTK